jgi:hypothetical protein
VWRPEQKPGDKEILKNMADSPSSQVGAVSITGNPVPLSRSVCMKSCGKPAEFTVDVSPALASKDAVWL